MPGRSLRAGWFSLIAWLTALLAVGVGLVVPPSVAVAAVPADGMTGAQLTTAFQEYGDTSGRWSGGDGAASVALPDGRVAWLFSDTYIGSVNADGSRGPSTFVNNAIVLQHGTNLQTTVHGGTAAEPKSLVPAPAGEMYWAADGIVEGGKLKVLYGHYKKTGSGSFDVALVGTALVTFTLPSLAVESTVELPVGATTSWGSAVLADGGYTYVYGSEWEDGIRHLRLARVAAGSIGGAWEFWTATGWVSSEAQSQRLSLTGIGTGVAVQKVGEQYVLVTVDTHLPFNSAVVAYTAPSPAGPFSGPVDLFVAPEPGQKEGAYVYDARLHPELAPDGRLLVSYNVNTIDPDALNGDASIYRPRFVDVAWPPAEPDPATLPAAPTGLTATADPLTGAVRLTWQPVAGSSVSYDVSVRDVTAGATHVAKALRDVTETSAEVVSVTSGHTYEFSVSAANSAGEGPRSAVVSATPKVLPPAAPTGVTATADDQGTVKVSWNAVAGAWTYSVLYRDVTAGETEFAQYGANSTSAELRRLTHNHEYEIKVTARGSAGDSDPSAIVKATARYAAPPVPTGVRAASNTDGTITLSWDQPAQAVWYAVYQRDVTAGQTWQKLDLPVTTCCEMQAGYLTDTHVYEFAIAAIGDGGAESARSASAQATSAYPAAAPPTALVAKAESGQVLLTWTASTTPEAWYWVYVRDVTLGEQFKKLDLPVSSCCSMNAGYLTNGHTYEFAVTAFASGRESVKSNIVSAVPDVQPPPTPTGVSATAQSNGRIKVDWQSSQAHLWYVVYQRDVTAGQAWQKLDLPITECCTFTAGLLTHQHVYEFKVAALGEGVEGATSTVVSARSVYAVPPAPTGLTGTPTGDGSVSLHWTPYDGDNVGYWVYLRDVTDGQTTFTRGAWPALGTSAEPGWLKHGHVYEFKVSAENPGGEGPASAPIRVTATGGLPRPPSSLTGTAGDGTVTLRWTASPDPDVMYVVWQRDKTAGEAWRQLPLPVSGCCVFNGGMLTNGHTYEFKVAAANQSGQSTATNVVSVKPMPPIPAPPTNLVGTAGNKTVKLTWNASPSSNVWYWVEVRPAGGSWTRLRDPVWCCVFNGGYLTNGVTYEFRVRTANIAGASTPSNVVTVRPMPPLPKAPTNLTGTAPGNGKVSLKWTASTTPDVYYWVEMREGNGAWKRLQYPSWCCSFNGDYLKNNVRYEFAIRAANIAGVSPRSNILALTPTADAPEWLRLTPGDRNMHVKWTPSTTPGVSYLVSWRLAGDKTAAWRSVHIMSGSEASVAGGNGYSDLYDFKVEAWTPYGPSKPATGQEMFREMWGEVDWHWMNGINGSNKAAAIRTAGKTCRDGVYQRVCFNSRTTIPNTSSMTVGDYWLYPGWTEYTYITELRCEAFRRANLRHERGPDFAFRYGPMLIEHEAIHSRQWAEEWDMWFYVYKYQQEAKKSGDGTKNAFEIRANLYWGDYRAIETRYTDKYELPDGCEWPGNATYEPVG
ncbi:fibronectin type III domain-containing protein [Nocardioides speluncae]|uniref:fibronectin type III domain-containing protein n=1 Tax=Nocardioides speluncae TaxID=2670337 RepID=UPI000D68A746|nr:fibronectin type III domain-containing protein [Nocardioides speluncae]